MEYELEVFEVYDDCEQGSNKKHKKHTRKKCKQKNTLTNIDISDNDDINRSKTSVVSSDSHRRPISLRQSIINVFSKIVIWKNQRRYHTTVPDKPDSPHTSKDARRGFIPCGKFCKEHNV